MLRITIVDSKTEQRWVLHGRLVQAWVDELRSAWKASLSVTGERRWVVDLTDVTAIDKGGEEVLRAMKVAGADLLACGVYTKHVVDGIRSHCREQVKVRSPRGRR